MTIVSPSVVDLRERPEFAPIIADRVWRAWWEPKGYALSFIEKLVQQNLDDKPIPLALVAHDGGTFLGTASVIASDLDERPQYTPWVAAVWVEPEHRSNGIDAALVRAGADKAHTLGFGLAYLCALPLTHRFYERLGWRLVEAGVTKAGLAILALSAMSEPAEAYVCAFTGMALIGMGAALSHPQLSGAVIALAPPEVSGMASALTIIARQTGFALGVATLGALTAVPLHVSTFVWTFGAAAAAAAGGVLACLLLPSQTMVSSRP